jgi:hypothetical protein
MKNIKRLEPMAYPLDPIPDDEPEWRDRPTVPGVYCYHEGVMYISHNDINYWVVGAGKVYGPIPPVTKEDQARELIMAGIVRPEYFVAFARNWRRALEFAKDKYRERHPGGCKMLSEGDACQCFLCEMDRSIAWTANMESELHSLVDQFKGF